ncbi:MULTISPECIES: ATP-dependent Clp protease adaptor ClpS [unclassified Crossiella]|uniref:ATP-dependent Clp protease adaptor ClpS n=1 Tax=unclassified Crossiella TaxID=2620835 RepID=UPI001FFEA3B4|nr:MULTISPECIES: ATP-dependent Clp protease adaptor ClpS [unclassified Crossiella]MCK2245307.1 ATP-dependent Clp protease adaptor ClpS [Crossiella sp. S99.2]MCK2258991.1 ATP-dependent Clp protease adaptor ClpS [Crossiella sp. S99.1]
MFPVVLHDDKATQMSVVAYALAEVCRIAPEEAVRLMLLVHNEGKAEAACYTSVDEAERVVAQLHFYGVVATVAVTA